MNFNIGRYEHLLKTRYKAKISEILLKNGRKLTPEAILQLETQLAQTLKGILEECGCPNENPTVEFIRDFSLLTMKTDYIIEMRVFGEVKRIHLKRLRKKEDNDLRLL